MRQDKFERTIIAQYANAGKLLHLLRQFNDTVDTRVDIDNFYRDVFNLDTRGAYGLSVCGRP